MNENMRIAKRRYVAQSGQVRRIATAQVFVNPVAWAVEDMGFGRWQVKGPAAEVDAYGVCPHVMARSMEEAEAEVENLGWFKEVNRTGERD